MMISNNDNRDHNHDNNLVLSRTFITNSHLHHHTPLYSQQQNTNKHSKTYSMLITMILTMMTMTLVTISKPLCSSEEVGEGKITER